MVKRVGIWHVRRRGQEGERRVNRQRIEEGEANEEGDESLRCEKETAEMTQIIYLNVWR